MAEYKNAGAQPEKEIDKIIVAFNDTVKMLLSGQCIGFCSSVTDITNKLFNLKNCVQEERNTLWEQVRGLEQANHDLMDKLNNG